MVGALIRLASRLIAVFTHRRNDRDLTQELDAHLEMLVEEHRRRGLGDEEARRAARLTLGSATQLRESHRDVRALPLLEELMRDLGYALRGFRRQPGFAITAVLTLAIGLGANTAIFSVIRAVLLRPLPYAHTDRLVTVNERWPQLPGSRPVSMLNYLDWAQQNTVFDRIAAVSWGSVTVSAGSQPVYVNGSLVSTGYFDVFGLHAALGRTFSPDDDQPGRDHVVVLGHRLWVSAFGADPAVVGTALRLDGESYTVIGVMPAHTSIEFLDPQVWRPLTFDVLPPRGSRALRQAVARLKPGVTLEQARMDMRLIAERLAADYPESNRGYGVAVAPLSRPLGLNVEASLYLLSAAVGVVLLIACVNLAALAMARGGARAREVTIRTALGAGRARLVRQFLTEHLVLGMVGGLAGMAVGYGVLGAMTNALPTSGLRAAFPPDTSVAIDGSAWFFAMGLSAVSGLAFGVAPAVSATRQSVTAAIHSVGRPGLSAGPGQSRGRQLLVGAQIAGTFVLVLSATLLVRGFFTLTQRVEAGFETANVLTAGLPTPRTRFQSGEALNAHLDEIARRIQSQPGILDVAFADSVPTQGAPYLTRFQIVGQPPVAFLSRPLGGFKVVSPSYLRAVGLRVIDGRALTNDDRDGAPMVVVVNDTLARTYFPGMSPVGQRLLMRRIPLEGTTSAAGPGRQITATADIAWTIVGVIANEGVDPFDDRVAEPAVYATREQHPRSSLALVVRTAHDPASVQESIRKTVSAFDRDQALADLQPLDRLTADDVAPDRLRSVLLGVFAAIALLLAAIGLYGVVAYGVSQRTREIGIRVALGASRTNVRLLVVRQTASIVAVGLVIGLGAALLVTRMLKTFLYGVAPADPASLAAVAGLLTSVAVTACYVPTRQATRVDPLNALRAE